MKYAIIPVLAVAAIAGFFLIKYNMDNRVEDRLNIAPTTAVFVSTDETEEVEVPAGGEEMVGQFTKQELTNVYNQFSTLSGEECQMSLNENGDMPFSSAVFGETTYVILPCVLYAYNVSNFVVVKDTAGWSLVSFETYNTETKQKGTMTFQLINAEFDAMQDKIYTFNKARGLGDCGTSEVYTVDTATKKGTLIEVSGKLECDGEAGDWPVLYTK